jgi:segregation and condensation protein B
VSASDSNNQQQLQQQDPFPEGSVFSQSFVREAKARLEVALYASGRPLGLDELCKAARIGSRERVARMLAELAERINSTFIALELREIDGQLYSLQLKPQFNSTAKKFATKPLLSPAVLKTLSYVVYLQPVSSQELVQRRGSQVYSHLAELSEAGFVRSERRGRARIYQTTDVFADYFGLSHEIEQQRKQVARHGLLSKAQSAEQQSNSRAPQDGRTEQTASFSPK